MPAEGDPEPATIYDHTGAELTNVTVYRTAIGDLEASMYMVPEPQPSWYTVAVAGALGPGMSNSLIALTLVFVLGLAVRRKFQIT